MAIKYPYEYDSKKRKTAKRYTRTRIINSLINSIVVSMAFFALMLYSGYSAAIREMAINAAGQFYVPVYIIMFLSLLSIAELPLSFYAGFIYEHKYGLSNQSAMAWIVDFLKEIVLMYVISVPVLTGLYVLIGMTELWYIYAALIYAALIVFFNYIYPIVIFPLFYKTEPFGDKKMKNKLIEMAGRAGVPNIRTVEVAIESEKSNKANAMFAGMGASKRIILFDTLLDNFTADEVETVVAHELGHYVNRDVLRFTLIEVLKVVPVFLVIIAVFERYSGAFGITGIGDVAGLPLMFLCNSIIGVALMGPMMAYSRKREKAADIFALEATGKVDAQVSTEKRLADMNLLDDSPHPAVEFFLYSHPPASKRIEYAIEWGKRKHSCDVG